MARPLVPGSDTEEDDILYNLQNGYNGGNTIYNNAPIRYCALRGYARCIQFLLTDPAVGGIKDALKNVLKYEEDPTEIVMLFIRDPYKRLSYEELEDIIQRHGNEFRDELLTQLIIQQGADTEPEDEAPVAPEPAAFVAPAAAATLPPEPEWREWGRESVGSVQEYAQRQESRSRSRSRSRSYTAIAPPSSQRSWGGME
jgi:hypothetical protein